MNNQKIILIGGGGHCKACIDVIEQTGKFEIVGIIDLPEKVGQTILGYPIIGTDEQTLSFKSRTDFFLVTIGQIGLPKRRKAIFEQLKNKNCNFATVISPMAYVSKHADIGEGSIIMHQALVNAGAKIGYNCIINNKALIEHDAIIGNNCHVSTASIINGGVKLGDNSFYGSGAVSKEYIDIEDNTIIGASSFVRKEIKVSGIYAGNPIKKYK